MNLRVPYNRLLIILAALALVTGLAFYFIFIFNPNISTTNPLSIIFAWQWLYLLVASVVVFALAIARRSKQLLKAVALILTSLVVVFVPAQFVFSKGLYVTGGASPSGPEFDCLVWNNLSTSVYMGIYPRGMGLCSLMSMPSLNKFLIDRSQNADESDQSTSYYVMFVLNEAVLLGGLVIARKSIKKASSRTSDAHSSK